MNDHRDGLAVANRIDNLLDKYDDLLVYDGTVVFEGVSYTDESKLLDILRSIPESVEVRTPWQNFAGQLNGRFEMGQYRVNITDSSRVIGHFNEVAWPKDPKLQVRSGDTWSDVSLSDSQQYAIGWFVQHLLMV